MPRSHTGRSLRLGRALATILGFSVLVSACQESFSAVENPDDALLVTASAPVANAAAQQAQFVEGRVLVRFNPGANAAGIASAAGASIQGGMALGIQILNLPAGRELTVAQALSNNPNVEFAEPDYIFLLGDPTTIPVNDPYRGYKWDLHNDGGIYSSTGDLLATGATPDADMDWLEALSAVGSSSGSARIGIMDTGIRNDHVEFAGRIAAQYDFFADDSNAEDDHGHGTHVAGIAAAATNDGNGVPGVAFTGNVTFAIAKVCGQAKRRGPFGGYGCPSSAIANGIVWAVNNGAHVLNLSLGGGPANTTTRDAMVYARSNNVLPICAAGNESGPVSYPGAYPECVAVSATDWSDGLASYSNFGSEVALAAPGGDDENSSGYSYILSASNGSSTEYVFMAGTSMASPQVAGLAALLHVLGVADDDAKLTIMIDTSDDLGPTGKDNSFGHGRVNIAAATADLGGGGPINQAPTADFAWACMELVCDFTDASGDADGSVAGWSWDFGDSSTSTTQNPTHAFGAVGTYAVNLTVIDDQGATGSRSHDVLVEVTPEPGAITLSATGYKVKGRQAVDLAWSGAASDNVDVLRDGALLITTANDGAYTDSIGARGGGTYSYQVCETETSTCSATITVSF